MREISLGVKENGNRLDDWSSGEVIGYIDPCDAKNLYINSNPG